jgi:hypothetical protein
MSRDGWIAPRARPTTVIAATIAASGREIKPMTTRKAAATKNPAEMIRS